jgi:heme/copper-type cytochrome/quinol oxidase subunit 4
MSGLFHSVSLNKKESDGAVMTDETAIEEQEIPRKKLTALEKQEQHISRIKKTAIACFLGIITGVISFIIVPPTSVAGFNNYTMLALFLMLAGVVVQRHIFILMKLTTPKMNKKDWIYQGFMTFAFWFISWSILLSTVSKVS